MTTVSRRWFRYSLRTLFVVMTLVAAPLGWLAVHERWNYERTREINYFRPTAHFGIPQEVQLPWGLRMIGAAAFPAMTVEVFSDADLARAQRLERLFPECKVVVVRRVEESPGR